MHVGRWWHKAEEVDVMAMRDGRVVLAGEAKWQRSPMDGRDLATLRRRLAMVPTADGASVLLASRSGFHPSVPASPEVRLVTPDDLFDPALEFELAHEASAG
jgi:hypothetical protein